MGKNTRVVAISFSPPEILEEARARARQLGFKNSFSAYVTKLVENDLEAHGEMRDQAQSPARSDLNQAKSVAYRDHKPKGKS